MKKRIFAVILVVAMVMGLIACGDASDGEQEQQANQVENQGDDQGDDGQADESQGDDKIVESTGTIPGTVLNSYVSSDLTNDNFTPWHEGIWGRVVEQNIFDGLTSFEDADRAKLVGGLAEKWDISEDKLTYTFYLRDGVTFTNGDAFTSADVVATWDYMMQFETAKSTYGKVIGWEAKDDMTVVFNLSEPWDSLLYYFAGQNCPIMNAKLIEQYGEGSEACVGTGAYYLDSIQEGASLTLKANQNYWKTPAQIETIIVNYIGNADTAYMALKTGELDFMYNLSEVQADEAQTINELEVSMYKAENAEALWFNAADESLTPEIRLALYYLLDTEECALAGFGNYGVEVTQNWIEEFAGYVEPSELTYEKEYNPEKGLQILEEADIDPESLTITILYPTIAAQRVKLAENIQAQLAEYGIKVVLDGRDWLSTRSALIANEYQCVIWDTEPALDAPLVAYTWLFTDGGFNNSNISNGNPELHKEIMELISKAEASLETAERDGYLQEITKLMNENVLLVPLATNNLVYSYSDDFNCSYEHSYYEYYYWTVNE